MTGLGILCAAVLEALGADGAGQPVLAFTQLENPQQLLSNRRPLWAAAVTYAGRATCTWHPVKLMDATGRTLYAEQPLLITGAAGQVLLTFRGMVFGGAANIQPGDPSEMISGQGEMESPLSQGIGVTVPPLRVYLPFVCRDGGR